MKTTLYRRGALKRPAAGQYDQASGAWLEHDAKGRVFANVLLELNTAQSAKENPAKLLLTLLPDAEVRIGLQARATTPASLAAWAAARISPAARALAESQVEQIVEEGMARNVTQYLWVRAKVAQGDHVPLAESSAELLKLVRGALVFLQIDSRPVLNWQSVMGSYEEPGAHIAEQPDCDILVEQSLDKPTPMTAYLQAPTGAESVTALVDALFQELSCDFHLWGTWSPLPAASDMKARHIARSELRWMLTPVSDKRMLELLEHAEQGTWGLFKWMLTLPDESSSDASTARALARNAGVTLMPTTHRWLGLFSYPKDFLATFPEAGRWLPLVTSVKYAAPDKGGLLLLNAQGEPTAMDVFVGGESRNVMVTGAPGSGKNFVGRALIEANLARGEPAWIIETHEHARALCELYGGEQVQVHDAATGLTPLAMVDDLEYALPLLVDWLQVMLPVPASLQEYSRVRLEKALREAYRSQLPAEVTLQNVQWQLSQLGDAVSLELAEQLAAYLPGGLHGELFSGTPMEMGSEGLTIFQPGAESNLVASRYSATLAVMLTLHWKKLPVTAKKLAFLSDTEYWAESRSEDQANMEAFGLLTSRLLRKARKLNAGWITTVHYIDFNKVDQSAVPKAQMESSAWHILQHTNQACRNLARYTPEIDLLWRKAATRRHMSEFVVLSPTNAPALMRLFPGELLKATLSTNWGCRQEYDTHRKCGKTPLQALRAVSQTL